METEHYPYPIEESWWARRRVAIHGWTAAAIVIALHSWPGFYEYALGRPWQLATLAVLVGLPAFAYVAHKADRNDDKIRLVWALFGAAVLMSVTVHAVGDARDHHFSNCWTVTKPNAEGVSTWECAPGGGEPIQWQGSYSSITDTEDTSYRFCESMGESSSGVTKWRCEEGD